MFNQISRVLSLVLTVAILLSVVIISTLTISAANTPSSWAIDSIEEAKAFGLATDDLLNDFQATTTRIEFCRAAVNMLRQYGYNVDSVTPKMFSDTSDVNIGIAATLGITNGTDTVRNLFTPNGELTREQAATMLNNVLMALGKQKHGSIVAWEDAAQISNWALQSASDMYNCGVISGTSTTQLVFSPKTAYTHEQSIVTLMRMWLYIDPSADNYNPGDYDPGNVRQSDDDIVLNDDVQSIASTSAKNVLVSFDETSKKYVFVNIDNSIKNLAIGDKFVIQPCSSIPNGLAIIVKSISVSGAKATIISNDVAFSDIVKSIDIVQIIPMTNDMIVDYGPGVSPAIVTNNVQPLSLVSSGNHMKTLAFTHTLSASKANVASVNTLAAASIGNTFTLPIDIPINDSIQVSGSIMLSPTLKADIDLHEGWWNIPNGLDYFELALDNRMTSTLHLEATYNGQIIDMASVYRIQDGTFNEKYANYKMTKAKCDAYKQKLFTSQFPIPTAPGLAATVTWYINVNASGQISVEAIYTQNNSFGIKYENTKWSPINTNESKLTVSGAADASLYAGVGIGIGLSYVNVVAATIEPEVGIEIAASTEYNATLIDSSGSTQESEHDCYLCVDGDVNLKISLGANIEAWGIGSVFQSGDLLKIKPWKLLDFYYSFGGMTHNSEFGLGICPYDNRGEQVLDGHRYQLFVRGIAMTWYEAKAYCESLGGHLATITTKYEQAAIEQLISEGSCPFYWIGATDELSEGTWRWITNEEWDIEYWAGSNPDNRNQDGLPENYLVIGTSTKRWDDRHNSQDSGNPIGEYGFICEWDI